MVELARRFPYDAHARHEVCIADAQEIGSRNARAIMRRPHGQVFPVQCLNDFGGQDPLELLRSPRSYARGSRKTLPLPSTTSSYFGFAERPEPTLGHSFICVPSVITGQIDVLPAQG